MPITRLVAHEMAEAASARRTGLRAALPRGRTLPRAAWHRRHRILRILLWAHVATLPPVSVLAFGVPPLHAVAHGMPMLALAIFAALARDRRLQAAAVAFGLLTSSATIVHASGGQIEAHFHFFVVTAALALYEDWLPYGLGVGFVAVHHLVGGLLFPGQVYNHGGDPLTLALVHTGFVLAAAVASVVTWRINEDQRSDTAAAQRTVEAQYEVSRALSAAVSLEDAAPRLLAAIGRGLGADVGLIWRPAGRGLRLDPRTMWLADPALDSPLRRFAAEPCPAGQGLAGRAWATGEPLWTADLLALSDDTRRPFVAATGQRSGVALPIRAGDDVLGVLSFTAAGDLPADTAVTELLASISAQLAVFMDRLRRSEELRMMEDAALSDPLTGLANRRGWERALARELDAHRGVGGRLSVAVVDLDRFKQFNDTHGHLAGDQLLRGAAAAWSDCIRERDVLARLGGDEFALLCPGTSAEDAEQVAARLRDAMPHQQRCSVGVATWDGAEPADALMERADRALYAAKRSGAPSRAPDPRRV